MTKSRFALSVLISNASGFSGCFAASPHSVFTGRHCLPLMNNWSGFYGVVNGNENT